MTYRSLHNSRERYQLLMLFGLIGAFVLAWAMMFVHPSVTLLLFWAALIFVGASVLVLRRYARAERTAAKGSLSTSKCPWCGAGIEHEREWHCSECGADFSDAGDELTHGR